MADNNAFQQYEPKINTKDIQDVYVRKNFQLLQDHFISQNQLLNFKFFEVIFTKATANYKLAHGFNYVPEDIIVSKLVGTGALTFNYGLFDTKNLDMTATGPCRVRFFVGSYWNYATKTAPVSTDQMQIVPTVSQTVTEIINYTTVNNISNVFNTTVVSGGSGALTIKVIVASYTALNTDDVIYYDGSANITVTLFAASTATKPLVIMNKGTAVVTIARAGTDLLDGEITQTLNPMTAVTALVVKSGSFSIY